MSFLKKCKTVGELRNAIKRWPDNKPLIFDDNGDTYLVTVYEWNENAEAYDLDWPAAIKIKE